MAHKAVLDAIRATGAYQELLADLRDRVKLPGLGLPRSARLPVLAALQHDLAAPVLLLTPSR